MRQEFFKIKSGSNKTEVHLSQIDNYVSVEQGDNTIDLSANEIDALILLLSDLRSGLNYAGGDAAVVTKGEYNE